MVECYIKYGWDHLLVDPDGGVNSRKKLAFLANKQNSLFLLQSLPRSDDPLWTKSLIQMAKVTYSKFLVDCKVSRKKVNQLEALQDIRKSTKVISQRRIRKFIYTS